MSQLVIFDVVSGMPIREFRSYRGRRHYSGWYWSSTMKRHVVYESRLELARILLADHDPDVVGIAAQPLLLWGMDGHRTRRHVPDVLLLHADSSVTVVDVKPMGRLQDEAVAAQFSWTREVCARQGWKFEVWSGAEGAELQNVRFLAGYRRDEVIEPVLLSPVLSAVGDGVSLEQLQSAVVATTGATPGSVRPVVFHLLWRGRLVADLLAPLTMQTVVRLAGGPA